MYQSEIVVVVVLGGTICLLIIANILVVTILHNEERKRQHRRRKTEQRERSSTAGNNDNQSIEEYLPPEYQRRQLNDRIAQVTTTTRVRHSKNDDEGGWTTIHYNSRGHMSPLTQDFHSQSNRLEMHYVSHQLTPSHQAIQQPSHTPVTEASQDNQIESVQRQTTKKGMSTTLNQIPNRGNRISINQHPQHVVHTKNKILKNVNQIDTSDLEPDGPSYDISAVHHLQTVATERGLNKPTNFDQFSCGIDTRHTVSSDTNHGQIPTRERTQMSIYPSMENPKYHPPAVKQSHVIGSKEGISQKSRDDLLKNPTGNSANIFKGLGTDTRSPVQLVTFNGRQTQHSQTNTRTDFSVSNCMVVDTESGDRRMPSYPQESVLTLSRDSTVSTRYRNKQSEETQNKNTTDESAISLSQTKNLGITKTLTESEDRSSYDASTSTINLDGLVQVEHTNKGGDAVSVDVDKLNPFYSREKSLLSDKKYIIKESKRLDTDLVSIPKEGESGSEYSDNLDIAAIRLGMYHKKTKKEVVGFLDIHDHAGNYPAQQHAITRDDHALEDGPFTQQSYDSSKLVKTNISHYESKRSNDYQCDTQNQNVAIDNNNKRGGISKLYGDYEIFEVKDGHNNGKYSKTQIYQNKSIHFTENAASSKGVHNAALPCIRQKTPPGSKLPSKSKDKHDNSTVVSNSNQQNAIHKGHRVLNRTEKMQSIKNKSPKLIQNALSENNINNSTTKNTTDVTKSEIPRQFLDTAHLIETSDSLVKETTATNDENRFLSAYDQEPTSMNDLTQQSQNTSRFNLHYNPGYSSIQSRMFSPGKKTTHPISPITTNSTTGGNTRFLHTNASQTPTGTPETFASLRSGTIVGLRNKVTSLYTLSEEDLKTFHDSSIPTIDELVRRDNADKRKRQRLIYPVKRQISNIFDSTNSTDYQQIPGVKSRLDSTKHHHQPKPIDKIPKYDPLGFQTKPQKTTVNTNSDLLDFHTGISDRYHSISLQRQSSTSIGAKQLQSRITKTAMDNDAFDNTMPVQHEITYKQNIFYSTKTNIESAEQSSQSQHRKKHGNWTLNIQHTSRSIQSSNDGESLSSFALSDFDFGESDVDDVSFDVEGDATTKGNNQIGENRHNNVEDETIKDIQL